MTPTLEVPTLGTVVVLYSPSLSAQTNDLKIDVRRETPGLDTTMTDDGIEPPAKRRKPQVAATQPANRGPVAWDSQKLGDQGAPQKRKRPGDDRETSMGPSSKVHSRVKRSFG